MNPHRSKDGAGVLQLVTFFLDGQEYGVNILDVQEIIRRTEVTRLPNAPAAIVGILNLRGMVVPIVDLRLRFGMSATQAAEKTRIIVLALGGSVFGILVDGVSEVLSIEQARIESAPTVSTQGHGQCVCGVGKLRDRMILLLDTSQMADNELLTSIASGCEEGNHV